MGNKLPILVPLLLHSLVTASATWAQAQGNGAAVAAPSLPESKAVRATGRIHLDGKLDESTWASAAVTDVVAEVVQGAPVEDAARSFARTVTADVTVLAAED